MSDRILNFSEFFKRYSKQSNKEISLDTIISSPQNFEDGFDETTYDKTQLGPNKPVSTRYQETPDQPSFSKEKDDSMEAPDIDIEVDGDTEEEVPEPEKFGANPSKGGQKPGANMPMQKSTAKSKEEEKKPVAESRILSFDKFFGKSTPSRSVYEYDDSYETLAGVKFSSNHDAYGIEEEPEEYGANPFGEDEDICKMCGNPYDYSYTASANPGMKTCGGNPMTGSCGS